MDKMTTELERKLYKALSGLFHGPCASFDLQYLPHMREAAAVMEEAVGTILFTPEQQRRLDPPREWACNRCMYSWNGNGGWCPMCGEQVTHGKAFEAGPEQPRPGESTEGEV